MADTIEIVYENIQTGKQFRCKLSEWEKIHKHKTLKRAFRVIKRELIPQAAVEAQAAHEQEQIEKRSRKKKGN